MKKILLLGGSKQQVPAIEYANEQGYYTILCDFLPDNPGRYVANKFYCESTTDQNKILEIAKDEKIDGIVAYASDPAAPTAAYVAEKMKLSTNPYIAIRILSEKDKFREFLTANNFCTPKALGINNIEEGIEFIKNAKLPLMVKPIDSSGSKGVSKINSANNFEEAFNFAMKFSRVKRLIVEEYIVQDHPYMIAGDCYVNNGEVQFFGWLNSHRNLNVNPYVPIGTSYPIKITSNRIKLAEEAVQSLLTKLQVQFGAFNLEIMIDEDDKVYLIEVGPRNGGNMIPELLKLATGVDMMAYTVDSSLGQHKIIDNIQSHEINIASIVLHSLKEGKFEGIEYSNSFKGRIIKETLYKNKGDFISEFKGSNNAVGILIVEFDCREDMYKTIDEQRKYIIVRVNNSK